jgi:hypothetical protein
MNQAIRIWKPVKRMGAERYVQLTILSFAASVSFTRLFLELAGYPQLGNQTYHIAHVLYGGLLLFIGGLLPLVYANRWVYTLNSILSGFGVGLFIDEVGKFITQTNDYFFPPAAPIIYAFFLVTVFVYIRVRGEPKLEAREELYMVFETLSEVLDHSLEVEERDEIKARLERIRENSDNPNYNNLTKELTDFIESDALTVVPDDQNFFEKLIKNISQFEKKHLNIVRLKAFLIISLFILGIPSAYRFINYARTTGDPVKQNSFLINIVSELPTTSESTLMWAKIYVAMDGLVGLVLGGGALLLLFGREKRCIELSSLALLVSIVTLNFVLFYIEQFSSIIIAIYQFTILQGLYYYERTLKKTELA